MNLHSHTRSYIFYQLHGSPSDEMAPSSVYLHSCCSKINCQLALGHSLTSSSSARKSLLVLGVLALASDPPQRRGTTRYFPSLHFTETSNVNES